MSESTPYQLSSSQSTLVAERIKRDYNELRGGPDLVRVNFPFGGEGWMSVKYDVAREMYNDPRFSVEKMNELDDYPRIRQTEKGSVPSFLQYDGTKHTTKRSVLMKHLTVKRVQKLVPATNRMITDGLDQFEQLGKPADMAAAFTRQIPLRVLCALLGTPTIEDPKFLEASYFLVDSSAQTLEEAMEAYQYIGKHFDAMYEEKKRNPGDDLLSALIEDTETGKWTDEELRGVGFTLLMAGHDATASMLTGILEWLSYEPELYERLRNEPESRPRALEEFFRCVTVGIGIPRGRIALEDVRIGDALVKAGDAVGGNIVAAHNDPDAYPNPNELDIDRKSPKPHMAFGYGPHACVGAQLARMEIRLTLDAIFSRYKTLRNVNSSENWRERRGMKGPRELIVTWDKA